MMRVSVAILLSCLAPCAARAAPPADRQATIQVGSLKRTYLVHVPPSYDPKRPAPVVLAFHGRLGTGEGMVKLSHLGKVADDKGFIAVFPDGIGRSWNAGHGTGPAEQQGVDDVLFVRKLIEALGRDLRIDRQRIYATGMSNGAIFSQRLACELGDAIAAIAPVAGTMAQAVAPKCRPPRPVPVLVFHGTLDRLVPWEGGQTRGGGLVESVAATIEGWRTRDGCSGPPRTTFEHGDARCTTYDACRDQAEVALCTIQDGGHTWPGGFQYLPAFAIGKTSQDIDASVAMWEFFARHKLPAPPRK